jgi:transcriptional regulator with XRE-family HTH domain
MTFFDLEVKEKARGKKNDLQNMEGNEIKGEKIEADEESKLHDAEIAKNVGRKIKFFRQLKGLSQSEIAVHLGITFQQFQKYESGKNRIPVPRLMKLANIFGVKMSIFFENTVNVMFEDMMGVKANRLNDSYTPLEFSSVKKEDESLNTSKINFQKDEEVGTLIKYFNAISEESLRKNILTLLKSISEEQNKH